MRICFRAYGGGGWGITICHRIQVPDRLIFVYPYVGLLTSLFTRSHHQFGFVRFSDCVGGFSSAAPLPPLGGIITTLGAQHPFGALSDSPICNRAILLAAFDFVE